MPFARRYRWPAVAFAAHVAVLLWFVLRYRYDAFYRGRDSGRDRSIYWRKMAFGSPRFIQDWRVTVGDDPPFSIVRFYNVKRNQTRIISYSLFGSDPQYYVHMLNNIRQAPIVYPGWTVRIYVHETSPDEFTRQLVATGAQVFVVHDDALRSGVYPGNTGTFWRFLPLADSTLDVMVLDADDPLDKYDAQIINPVLSSTACLGGMWTRPFPQQHLMAAAIIKTKRCKMGFTAEDVKSFPVRAPYGADEYFMTVMPKIGLSDMHTVFSDNWEALAWHTIIPSVSSGHLQKLHDNGPRLRAVL